MTVMPVDTEYLSDAEVAGLKPHRPSIREWVRSHGAAMAIFGCLLFWAVIAIFCIAFPDFGKFVMRMFIAVFVGGCISAVALDLGWRR